MIERTAPGGQPEGRITLLMVATVAGTIRGFLLPYAAHFRALGWRVEAAANGASDDVALQAAFDRVHELPLSRSILDARGLIRGERAISEVMWQDPDIVHVHTPIASFMTRLAIRRMAPERRPAVVYTAHGFHFHRGGRPWTNTIFLAAEKLAGRWTDRLVVINDEDHEAARRHRIVAEGRLVRMSGIGVDTTFYSRAQVDPAVAVAVAAAAWPAPGNGQGAAYFVSVAELSQRKRNADVIRALGLMRHRDVHLVMAGEGPERGNLEGLVAQLGLKERVTMAGSLADVRPIVVDAAGLVLASDREGLARAVMEALSMGVPVIASTARGNRELVPPDSGFIVPTGDVAGLAAAMDWLIDHPDDGREMGSRGRERMVAGYDIRPLIARHEAMYRELLAGRGKLGT